MVGAGPLVAGGQVVFAVGLHGYPGLVGMPGAAGDAQRSCGQAGLGASGVAFVLFAGWPVLILVSGPAGPVKVALPTAGGGALVLDGVPLGRGNGQVRQQQAVRLAAVGGGRRNGGDGDVGDVAVAAGEPPGGRDVADGLSGRTGPAGSEDCQVRVVPPAARGLAVTGADQVDLVPAGRVSEEGRQAGELACSLRQPDGHDQVAAGQPGVDDSQRTVVAAPGAGTGLRGRQRPGLGEHTGSGTGCGGFRHGGARDGGVVVEVALQGAGQPVGLPGAVVLCVGAGASGDAPEVPP